MSDQDLEGRIRELIEEAEDLEYGTVKAALLEEAVRLADLLGDIELGFEVRQGYMDAANFAGQVDQMLVAFSWCLAQFDRHPDRFSELELLWKFKWVLGHLPEFPQVSWEQIEAMLADMRRRYEGLGASMRPIYSKQRTLAMHRGDRAAAKQAHKDLQRSPRDMLSDCPACEVDSTVEYLVFLGEYEQAVEKAGAILTGRQRCAEVPHRTYARVLLPLLRLDRLEEAMNYHVRGYRLIHRNPSFIYAFGHHIDFLTLTDNLSRALKLVEKHLADALVCPARTWRIDFYLAARLLMQRLQEQGKETVKLRLCANFPLHNPENRYAVADLEQWFSESLTDLAGQLDARNGTDFYARKVADASKLIELVRPYPLPGQRKNEA